MSRGQPLSRAPRGWLAVAAVPTGLEYAVARDREGQVQIEREAVAASPVELTSQVDAKANRITTAVGSEDVFCETIQLPTAEPGELRQMLELQLDQMTPLPLEEVVYDFTPLETSEGKTRVLVALGRKSAINDRVAPLEAAGLPPERVTVDVLALFRALLQRGALPNDDRLNGLAQIQRHRVDLVLFSRSQPVAVRTILREGELADFAWELQRTVVAAQVQLPGLELGKLTVVGAESGEAAQAWGGAVETLTNGAVPSLAASLCADLTGLNLLPEEWRTKRRRARTRQTWVRIGVAAAVVYLLALTGFLVAIGFRKAHLNNLRAEKTKLTAAYQGARQLHSELLAMQSQLDDKYSALEVLREVTSLLPENVKLSAFNFRRDDAVTLKGQADTAQSVYSYVERLQRSGLFGEVKTGGGGVRSDPGSGLTRFEVTASLKSAAGKPGGAAWR